ncbi:MAG: trypsin-like serine protease [Myxococcaceae bacterium]
MRRTLTEACILLNGCRPVPPLLLLLLLACSPSPVQMVQLNQQALTSSELSADDAVVAIVDGTGTVRCSGSLLAPRTVLTSTPCLQQTTGTLTIYVGPSVNSPVQTVQVRQSVTVGSLALLQLDAQVSGVIPLNVSKTVASSAGAMVRRVGYGATVTGGPKLERRAGPQTVSSLSATHFTMDGAARVCDGDLGAPALTPDGIISVAEVANCTMGTGTDTRADVSEQVLSETWNGWEGGGVPLPDGGIAGGPDAGFEPVGLHGWALGCAQSPPRGSGTLQGVTVLLGLTLCVARRKASKR